MTRRGRFIGYSLHIHLMFKCKTSYAIVLGWFFYFSNKICLN